MNEPNDLRHSIIHKPRPAPQWVIRTCTFTALAFAAMVGDGFHVAVAASPDRAATRRAPGADTGAVIRLGSAEIFAPGEISGPGSDGAPTFSPDGKTLFFTRGGATWATIVESHRVGDHWAAPTLAPFSGAWSDQHPVLSRDGTYLIFVSTRPAPASSGGPAAPGHSAALWRSDGRRPGDTTHEHLYIVYRPNGGGWGAIIPVRYADDDANGSSNDDESRLSPDRRTLYFTSDRTVALHHPATREEIDRALGRLT